MSSSARTQPARATTLAVTDAPTFKSIRGALTPFDQILLDNSAVLVKYTWYGDANFNGKVDGADYARIDGTFNTEHTQGNIGGWVNGDFNYSDKVDGADYALIDSVQLTGGNTASGEHR